VRESRQNLLVFHTSGQECAVPLDAVQEVVPMALLSTPPGLPSLLAGFLDLGGTAIPIVRLDRLFDLPEQPPGLYTPLLVLRGCGDGPTGILVGGVRKIAAVTQSSFVTLPPKQVFHDCAVAEVEIDGSLVHLLSPERILLENERRMLAGIQAMAQQRLRHLQEGV
jgi:purine-binding chemotaxis protein CheW